MKRFPRRIRNKKCPMLYPLTEIKVNDILASTGGSEPKLFLIYDDENVDLNRIIICASPEGSLELFKSVKWCMD